MEKPLRQVAREIVAAVIESSDGFLLFGKSRKGGVYQGCWVIPGGGVNEGETNEEALHREILEETGLSLTEAKVIKLRDDRHGTAVKTLKDTDEEVEVLMHFFDHHAIFYGAKDTLAIAANDDLTELRWFSKEELKDLTLSPPTIELLQEMGYLK